MRHKTNRFVVTIANEELDLSSFVDDSPLAHALRQFVKVRRQAGRVMSLQIDNVIIRPGDVFDTDARSRPVLAALERLERKSPLIAEIAKLGQLVRTAPDA